MSPLHPKGVVVNRIELGLRADKFLKVQVEPTIESVAFGVHGLGLDSPAAFGKDVRSHPHVDVIIEGKIVPDVPQAQTSNLLFSIGWKDHPGCLFLRRVRNQSKRQSQGSRNTIKIEIKWS